MKLTKASKRAVRYAILNWHYSRAVPNVCDAHNVFNDEGEWCGVICYGIGACPAIAKAYGLPGGSVIELVRVALNGKQSNVSSAMAVSLKLLKKANPLVKMVVSYADPLQEHVGTVYQATNWYYVGMTKPISYVINPNTGKIMHPRSASSTFGSVKGMRRGEARVKHKYLYPLDKSLRALCENLRQPYPKKVTTNAAVA